MSKRFTSLTGLIAGLVLAAALGVGGLSHHADAQVAAPSRTVELLPSTVLTATGTGSAFSGFEDTSLLRYQVICTGMTGTTPSYTFTLQDTLNGGVTWNTLATATALTASGNSVLNYSEVRGTTAQAYTGTLRTAWTVTGTTPSATCRALLYAE